MKKDKFYLLDYKGKWFVIQDKEDEMFPTYEVVNRQKILQKEFIEQHKSQCEYYGIPAYIGKDEELNKIYK